MQSLTLSRKRAAEGDRLEAMTWDAFNKTINPNWVSPHKRKRNNGGDHTSSPFPDNTKSSPENDEIGFSGVGLGPDGEQESKGGRSKFASSVMSVKRRSTSEHKQSTKIVSSDNDIEMQDATPLEDTSRSRPIPSAMTLESRKSPTLSNPHSWPPTPKILPFKEGGHSHPRVARTDVEFEEMFDDLQSMIWTWSMSYFTSSLSNLPDLNIGKIAKQQPRLIQYLNHVITSSNDFELTVKCHLSIIIYGIIAKSLEVHVFGHEMFGATEAQLDILRKIDIELAHVDSFVRHHTRATLIRSFLKSESTPPRYDQQIDAICLDLHTLLEPLIAFTRRDLPASDPINKRNLATTLYYIVERAAYLSLSLRREPDTVYLFLPLSKEGSDYDTMLGDNPLQIHTNSAKIPVETDNVEIKEATPYHAEVIQKQNQPVVPKFLLWPQVQAYRPNLEGRKGHKEAAGLRSRIICRTQIALGRLETPDEPKLVELLGVKAVRERAYKGVATTLAVGILMSLWKDGKLPEYTAFLKKVAFMSVNKALQGAELLSKVGEEVRRSIVAKRGYWPLGTEAWNRDSN